MTGRAVLIIVGIRSTLRQYRRSDHHHLGGHDHVHHRYRPHDEVARLRGGAETRLQSQRKVKVTARWTRPRTRPTVSRGVL